MVDYDGKYSGEQIDALLDQVASGNTGGGGVGPQGPKGEDGEDGVGIASVKQTTTSSADSGSNVVTVTLTNGTTSTFTVKNGSKGSQGEKGDTGETGPQGPQGPQGEQGIQGPKGDTGATGADGAKGDKGDKGDTGANGTNGKDGADGEDGATFTPSVDSEGNLSWTNDKGLTNPPTVNIKGPKGDAGSGGGGGTSEKEIVSVSNGVIEVLEPNKIYVLENLLDMSPTFEIQSIAEPNASYAEYYVIIYAETSFGGDVLQPSISLPDVLRWPNGSVPDITKLGVYELNIVYSTVTTDSSFNAVLTPFQYVE